MSRLANARRPARGSKEGKFCVPHALNNPINYTDPSGHWECESATDCSSYQPPPEPPIWIWYILPIEEPGAIQWYGNTEFAYIHGKENNYHNFAQGMHPGIDMVDFPSENNSIPIYAGAYGTVLCITGQSGCGAYAPGRINVENGDNVLVYGHVYDVQVEKGDQVTPHTILGYIDSGEVHVHIEIMRLDEDGYYMVNPLPYFRPALQNELLQVAADMNPNDSRIRFHDSSSSSMWQSPFDQPVLRRIPGWLFVE